VLVSYGQSGLAVPSLTRFRGEPVGDHPVQ
jgi:hypothetical protein